MLKPGKENNQEYLKKEKQIFEEWEREEEAEEGINIQASPSWMVTYGDLITQLLVFFIMFYSVTRGGKISELERALEIFQRKDIVVEKDIKPGEVIIRIPSGVLFDSGKAELREEASGALEKAARMIQDVMVQQPQAQIRIEGHTDNVPLIPGARYPSNWELSADRAIHVVKFFVDRDYFSPEILQAMGYGKTKPIASNDTIEGRQRNRRVEIKVVFPNYVPLPADSTGAGGLPAEIEIEG
jgi:flagellar motor protein MotB